MQGDACYYLPHHQPTADSPESSPVRVLQIFAYARMRRRNSAGYFAPAFYKSNPRPAIPVRVRRRIVPILTREASIASVVQIRKAPRATHAGGVRPIEGRQARLHTLEEYQVNRGISPLAGLLRPFTPFLTRSTKPRPAIPVRARRRTVPTLTREASIASVVQSRKAPRATHAGGARPIEGRLVVGC